LSARRKIAICDPSNLIVGDLDRLERCSRGLRTIELSWLTGRKVAGICSVHYGRPA